MAKTRFDLDKVQTPAHAVAATIATGLGSGLVPVAPGTCGTLVGLPLAFWLAHEVIWIQGAAFAVLFALGVWAIAVLDRVLKVADPSFVVIDEVLGMIVTSWAIREEDPLWMWLAGFVAFRIADVLKPPPVRWLDRWSKTARGWRAGVGIIIDDLAAAVFAALALVALRAVFA